MPIAVITEIGLQRLLNQLNSLNNLLPHPLAPRGSSAPPEAWLTASQVVGESCVLHPPFFISTVSVWVLCEWVHTSLHSRGAFGTHEARCYLINPFAGSHFFKKPSFLMKIALKI